jgi:hypothetical protein
MQRIGRNHRGWLLDQLAGPSQLPAQLGDPQHSSLVLTNMQNLRREQRANSAQQPPMGSKTTAALFTRKRLPWIGSFRRLTASPNNRLLPNSATFFAGYFPDRQKRKSAHRLRGIWVVKDTVRSLFGRAANRTRVASPRRGQDRCGRR